MACAIINKASRKASRVLLILKFMIFISLAVIFYIFYFTEVVNKFAERDTTMVLSQETIEKNETSYTGGPLQTSRLGFFNLFHETLDILSNINSFHPAADARGVRGATERKAGQRANGGTVRQRGFDMAGRPGASACTDD